MVRHRNDSGEWTISENGLRGVVAAFTLIGGVFTVATAIAAASFKLAAKADRTTVDSLGSLVAENRRTIAADRSRLDELWTIQGEMAENVRVLVRLKCLDTPSRDLQTAGITCPRGVR